MERTDRTTPRPTPVSDDATATPAELLERAAADYTTGWGSTRIEAEGSSDR